MTPQEIADQLYEQNGVFLGGPRDSFERVGRFQLITLLKCGLYPFSRVLDVGCGTLRGGYWLVRFLNRGCYYGIEPKRERLDAGKSNFLGEDVMNLKSPNFSENENFDFGVFGVKFGFVLARSVWTHASRRQILAMLDSFVQTRKPGGKMLTSYLQSGWLRKRPYLGDAWVGRDKLKDEPGLVHHPLGWIRDECKKRGMVVSGLVDEGVGRQPWLLIA